jgi:hypothetical protein
MSTPDNGFKGRDGFYQVWPRLLMRLLMRLLLQRR